MFGLLFLGALSAQSVAGYHKYNEDERAHAQLLHERPQTISYGRYLTSSSFGQAVTENWQSEYLQFSLYIFATIWLLQRGSPESKELDKSGRESDRAQRVGALRRRPLTAVGEGRRAPHSPLFELAPDRDAADLLRVLVRAIRHGLE